MTDPVPDTKPGTRWMYVGILVFLVLALVFYLFNTDGGEEPVPVGEVAGEAPNPLPTTTSVPVSPEGEFGAAPVNGDEPAADADPEVEIEPAPQAE
ncbi:hypothetical protein GRI42_10345 [Erythrobacter gaetbuli]|uniref:Uncharacterized protein n=1 Tax=Qipengyuania gaetbuli TaxID=266952 RepID=A0A844Y0Y0_9SPHN|nr:hypothetical protein [Qipengyuania gaetbuli]MXO51701.1 hypothetical protein [Qipengyuania gaetbuli]